MWTETITGNVYEKLFLISMLVNVTLVLIIIAIGMESSNHASATIRGAGGQFPQIAKRSKRGQHHPEQPPPIE